MSNSTSEKVAKKPRAPRQKKQPPTKEETLKMLLLTINELKQIVQDLKEDEMKVSSLPLKKIPELLKETISNLEEDLEEIQSKYDELLSYEGSE